jgi:hypothetical protein
MENYQKQLSLAKHNLEDLVESFFRRDKFIETRINNFLSSIQSVIWMLNKTFGNFNWYELWKDGRWRRLGEDAKIFKELRNISIKEYPIEVKSIIIWFKIEYLPAYATFIWPVIDTRNALPISNKWIIRTQDGIEYETECLTVHDFSVNTLSNKKEYYIENFITSARKYIQSIETEITATEKAMNINGL